MSPKQELLNRAAEEYKAFHDAIRGLNEEQMTEPWLGSWSIKEIAAHISGWQRELTPALERLARGERGVPPGVSYDDVDGWNARFAAAVRDVEVTEVLLEMDKNHERFMRAADSVPDARFEAGRAAYRIVDQTTAHHYQEHAAEIVEWRASRGI